MDLSLILISGNLPWSRWIRLESECLGSADHLRWDLHRYVNDWKLLYPYPSTWSSFHGLSHCLQQQVILLLAIGLHSTIISQNLPSQTLLQALDRCTDNIRQSHRRCVGFVISLWRKHRWWTLSLIRNCCGCSRPTGKCLHPNYHRWSFWKSWKLGHSTYLQPHIVIDWWCSWT